MYIKIIHFGATWHPLKTLTATCHLLTLLALENGAQNFALPSPFSFSIFSSVFLFPFQNPKFNHGRIPLSTVTIFDLNIYIHYSGPSLHFAMNQDLITTKNCINNHQEST
ncbi:hypothetical protein Hdeb2414_s0028g00698701 [Helianthus debilis subsp. tardiflorus]